MSDFALGGMSAHRFLPGGLARRTLYAEPSHAPLICAQSDEAPARGTSGPESSTLLPPAAQRPAARGQQVLARAMILSVLMHALLVFGFRAMPGAAPQIDLARPLVTRLADAPMERLAPGARNLDTPKERFPESEAAVRPALKAGPTEPSAPEATATSAFAGQSSITRDAGTQNVAAYGVALAALDALQPPRYYLPAELDVRALPLSDIVPPDPGLPPGIMGYVKLQVLVNEFGTVDAVNVIDAKPQGAFELSAVAAFRLARFSPGSLEGRAVKSQFVVQVDYDMGLLGKSRVLSGRSY